jgi:hypothetical protein
VLFLKLLSTFLSTNEEITYTQQLEQFVWKENYPHVEYSKKATLNRRLHLCKICDIVRMGCLRNYLVQNHGDF